MELFEKVVSKGGKVTYRPHNRPVKRTEFELTDAEIVTLTTTLGTCILMGVERHMPPHSALGRRVQAVEDALKKLAQLSPKKLDERIMTAGLLAWNAAIEKLADEVSYE